MPDRLYSFDDFINSMLRLQWHEMIPAAENACAQAEHASYIVRGARAARAAGSVDFAERLKAFLFWLRYGQKPFGVDEYDWRRYRDVAEHLVRIGNFKPEVLNAWTDAGGAVV